MNIDYENFLQTRVAKAIARAHCDKLNMQRVSPIDRNQFARDWWHYFMMEAKAAMAADLDWHWQRRKKNGLR